MRKIVAAFALVRALLSREVQRDWFMSLVQLAGVLVVLRGIAGWSVEAAEIVGGLTAAVAAEMWMRGDHRGRT